ncbi:MAG: DUF2231 domain-containing protein [Syntrophorhabdaceae bacterium]
MREIDKKELAGNNGQNGKPCWVVYEGKVYDLSESSLWDGGSHMGSHNAGRDMTQELLEAPHGPEMLERYEQIGVLKIEGLETAAKQSAPPAKKASAAYTPDLMSRFPMLRRHPHPMTVHFPIVFMFSAPLFIILYFLFDTTGFEFASFYCLGAGLIFIPVAMITGYISWHINYNAHPIRAVSIKKVLSVILLCMDIVVFVWRVRVPDILHPFTLASFVYFLLVLSGLFLVIIIGWYGATLTFPLAGPKR